MRRLTPRKNVPEQRKNVLIQRRMFQLREDSFDSKEECSSPKDACSDQKKECSNPEKNVPEHSSLGWNLHPWVRTFFLLAGTFFFGVRTFFLWAGTFFFGSEHSSFVLEHSSFWLEHSSLVSEHSSLGWNLPLLPQNILLISLVCGAGTFLFFISVRRRIRRAIFGKKTFPIAD